MKKINVLVIIPKAQQGGAETQALYLMQNINLNKFNVHLGYLYQYSEIEHSFNNLSKRGIKLVYFEKKGKSDFSVYKRIAKYIDDHDINIINSFLGSHNAYLPSLLAKRRCIPIGGIMMAAPDKLLSRAEKIQEFIIGKALANKSKLFMVSCSHSGAEVFKKKGFPKSSVFTIPNGIDFKRFSKPSIKNRDRIIREFRLNRKITICMVGRLADSKNQEALIHIFKGIHKNHRNTKLMLVGAGPDMERLKKLSHNLGIEKEVVFTGNRGDIQDILAAIDIFAFPSLTEGWPNVVGEAMCAGKPVVSFDVGDINYIIKDGINGFNAGFDNELMKNKIIQLIEDKKLRENIGAAAKKRMRNSFSVKKMVSSYETLYKRLYVKHN